MSIMVRTSTLFPQAQQTKPKNMWVFPTQTGGNILLKEVAKSVLYGIKSLGKNEFNLLLKNAVIVNSEKDHDKLKNGKDPVKVEEITIRECGFVARKVNDSITIRLGKVDRLIEDFRKAIVNNNYDSLIGMELKRGCQPDREWISDISIHNNEITVHSSTGYVYRADSIRVYKNEEDLCSLYDFAAFLEGCKEIESAEFAN